MAYKHVLIVGGGLAGPALAIALARQSIRSTIFEIRASQGSSGGSITLMPSALKVLEYIGVGDQVRRHGYSYERLGVYDSTGYRYGDFCMGEEGGQGYLRIMRADLHSVLLKECADLNISIKYGAKLRDLKEEKDRVLASFEDGSSETGDILIGADGIHSAVRKHVLGASAPKPVYSGSITVNGFMSRQKVEVPSGFSGWPSVVLTPQGIVTGWLVDPEGSKMAWGVSLAVEEKSREGFAQLETSGEALRMVKEKYADIRTDPIRSLLEHTGDDTVRLWSPHSLTPDLPKWHGSRTLLIGDAAHALPPNGSGSAAAFEDAVLLARMVTSDAAQTKEPEAIFAHFEQLRRVRIEQVKKLSNVAGAAKSTTTNPVVWWLKRWAMYAFFAYNRFEIRPKELGNYDATKEDISSL